MTIFQPLKINIQDEGVDQGKVKEIDFTGSGVSVAVVGSTATVTVGGGSGSGDVVGPATNTDSYIPQWNGVNSKTLKDGLAVPAGGLAGITALNDKAPIASPSFTGTVTTAGNIELGHASDTTLARVSAGVISVEGVTVPTISSTSTLTNKRVTERRGSTTSSATPTINTDTVDIYSLTAQTVDITSFTTNLSGTPTHGQSLIIEITGTAARAITWGSSFEASTVALPTTTVTTNMLTVGFKWNSATSKWRCLASA